MPIDHKEVAFETAIEDHLLDTAGYQKANPADFDRERAIDPKVFLAFLQESQPSTWEALEKLHGAGTATIVLDDLSKALDGTAGSLGVLRHGFKCFGKRIDAAYFAPAHGMNPGERAALRGQSSDGHLAVAL
jgi:type I restriction enzyme R subunit